MACQLPPTTLDAAAAFMIIPHGQVQEMAAALGTCDGHIYVVAACDFAGNTPV